MRCSHSLNKSLVNMDRDVPMDVIKRSVNPANVVQLLSAMFPASDADETTDEEIELARQIRG